MEVIQDQTIVDECVRIDGKCFINCTLEGCILEYSGDEVSFERTVFRGCRYVFYGHALRTVHFLQGSGLMPHIPSEWGTVHGTVH